MSKATILHRLGATGDYWGRKRELQQVSPNEADRALSSRSVVSVDSRPVGREGDGWHTLSEQGKLMKSSRRRLGAGARRTAQLAVLAVATLVLSSCYYLPAALTHRDNDPTTRPWWCDSTGSGGGHAAENYPGMVKGELSWDDCMSVSAQFDLALDYATQYPTAGSAESNGFHKVVGYEAGMGTHHSAQGNFDKDWLTSPDFDPDNPVFPGTELDGHFDPTKPEYLMYGGNGPSAKLVGMAWYVRTDTGKPPAGFVGDNDWWHVHKKLCMRTSDVTIVGEDISDASCTARGGLNLNLENYYMVHAWIVPGWEQTGDVFMGHHPCLKAGGPAPADDPCWAMANPDDA